MRYLSLCSGIEAASVAWGPLGWEPVAFFEIDRFPSAVLAHRFPGVPNHGDFTKILTDPNHPIRAEHVDLLVGGTPCQDFSVAGLRAGIDGARGNLTLAFLQVVAVLRPRWVLWENVPGVLSSDGGRALGAFLGGLGELGYGWAYRVLDAQYVRVDGYPRAVPQRRQRVFVAGRAGGSPSGPASVLFEPEGVRWDSPPRRKAGEGTAVHAIKSAAIGRKPENGPQHGEVLTDGSVYTLNCVEQHAVAMACNAKGGAGRMDAESETLLPTGGSFEAFMPARTLAADGGVDERFAPRDVCDALHTKSGGGQQSSLVGRGFL